MRKGSLVVKKREYQDLIKISHILNSTVKMDTILIDQDGNALFKLINHPIPPVLDPPDNEYKHIHEILSKKPANYCLHYTNTYGLEYMAVRIGNSPSFLAIGPFISSMSIIDRIKDIISRNKLPIGERKQLEQFYQSLPVLSEMEYKNIGVLMVNLCVHHYIASQQISTNTMKPLLNLSILNHLIKAH